MNLKKILVLGAGRSSSACISYLIDNASAMIGKLQSVIIQNQKPRKGSVLLRMPVANSFNIDNTEASRDAISKADVVIFFGTRPAFILL